MNYRVIGTDGREYGPVSQEQVRSWIGEGRANAATLVCAEGSMDWRALGVLPEFRPFVSPASAAMTATPSYPGARRTNAWAIWGFACGLLSLTLCSCCCCLPLNVLGIVFSIIGLVQISNNPQTQTGTTLAILGLVLSVLSFVLAFACSAFWFSSGAGEEFRRELQRELGAGAGSIFSVFVGMQMTN